jgi:superfamily II DNA or RNA helicase
VYERKPETTGIWGSVQVQIVPYEDGPRKEIVYADGRLGFAAMTVGLSKDEERNKMLLRIGCKCVEDGRSRTLVLTSFRDHLRLLQAKFSEALGADRVAVLHGTATHQEKSHARGSDIRIIVATYAFVEEGYDDNSLDTLVLATPRSRVQQSVGRIERTKSGKAIPLVVDVLDTWSIYARMIGKRKQFYKSRGFTLL